MAVSVLGKRSRVTTTPPESCQEAKRDPLDDEGHHRQMDLVEVLVEEHGNLKHGARHSAARGPDPSVALQAEEDP
jgi:hypothetical protein